MCKRYFTFVLAFVFFCAASGAGALAQEKSAAKTDAMPERVMNLKRKVFARGTGTKARVGVKLNDGTKLKGYVSEATADSFTVVRTDAQPGTPVKINYEDVREFKAHGKGLSTTSKVLIGVGIGFVITTGLLVLLFKDGGHISLR